MISFKQFLNEGQELSYKFDEGIELIKDHCRDFISLSSEKPLFRGISKLTVSKTGITHNNVSDITWSAHPKNRSPKDSDAAFNFAINAMFDAAFALEDVRKQSIFATGKYSQSVQYGAVMYCFPKGKIRWLWSPKIEDAYEQARSIYENIVKHSTITPIPSCKMHQIFDDLQMIYRKGPHSWVYDLEGDAEEHTVKAVSTAIPNVEETFGKSPYNAIHTALINTAQDLYSESKGLDAAIASENEIMIYESDGYYMVPLTTVVEAARQEGIDVMFQDDHHSIVAYRYLLKKLS